VPTSDTTRDRLDVVATLLLAVAAVATAWASYQATRWNGEQSRAASRTNALRIEAARAAGLAESETQVDVATFIGWVDARGSDDEALADFFEQRFRPEFGPAFDAWLATDPLTNPTAPPTPFAMDEYRLEARSEAERLDLESEVSSATVSRNIQRAADYVLCVTLFAVSLFFAGMSTRITRTGLRTITLGIGCAVFLGAAIWLATLPKIVSV
jgi:hypothetical protein